MWNIIEIKETGKEDFVFAGFLFVCIVCEIILAGLKRMIFHSMVFCHIFAQLFYLVFRWYFWMKKFLSISFSVLILLSVMQLTISTHYCGGVIASTKVSVSGALASCGMEAPIGKCPSTDSHLGSNCCNNKVIVFAVENNYTPSFSEFKTFSQSVLQVFDIPANSQINTLSVLNLSCTNVSPPGSFMVSDVSLPYICVFRIWCYCLIRFLARKLCILFC